MENGKAFIARGLDHAVGFASTEFHVLRPSDDVLAEWVFHYVRQQSFRDLAAASMTGTAGQLRVPVDFLREARIPVPPLAEQRRIMAWLEGLLGRVERATKMIARSLAILDTLVAGSAHRELLRICESHDTAGIVGEYLEKLQYGTSVKADASHENGVPVLRMNNIRDGALDFSSLKYVELAKEDVPRYRLREGDVLINRTNSPELVGKCAVFDSPGQYLFASYLIRLVPAHDKLNPHYLNYWINSPLGRSHIYQVKHQVAGQANINSDGIRNMPIVVPPMERQSRVVCYLNRFRETAARARLAANRSLGGLSHVRQAILNRAFQGAPVTTGQAAVCPME